MATAARIEANRRNAQKSTGPWTAAGKARSRLNALKHGDRASLAAGLAAPVLPQENPAALAARTERWLAAWRPSDEPGRQLVILAARISWQLDRAGRAETALLSRRVVRAGHKAAVREAQRVCTLGRRLLTLAGPRTATDPGPAWDDDPAVFRAGLEATAAGCRFLLEKWGQFICLLERRLAWTNADLWRFARLLGKQPVEAVNDPVLNALFLAWDVLGPGTAADFWEKCKELTPRRDPGLCGWARWRELADRPADHQAAAERLWKAIEQDMAHLRSLLAEHEAAEALEEQSAVDASSFDFGVGFERLRRYQSAKVRELRVVLDELRKRQAVEAKSPPPTPAEPVTPPTEPSPPRSSRSRPGGIPVVPAALELAQRIMAQALGEPGATVAPSPPSRGASRRAPGSLIGTNEANAGSRELPDERDFAPGHS